MIATVKDGVLTLPRELPQEGMLILTRGVNDTVSLFTPGQWTAFEEKMQNLPLERSRKLKQFFYTQLYQVEVLDYQIQLPAIYRIRLKEGPVSVTLDERGCYILTQEDAE